MLLLVSIRRHYDAKPLIGSLETAKKFYNGRNGLSMKTQRAKLELIKTSDFEDILELFKEPETFRYIGPLDHKDESFYRNFLQSRIDMHLKKTGYYWVARISETDQLIGCMNLNPSRGAGPMQLGFQISRKFQGQGFATELSEPILHFAKHHIHLSEVYAFWELENIASGKVLQKLGFEFLERKQLEADDEILEVYIKRFN